MATVNVPLNELATTENLDFSHRGTPLTPSRAEHYTNKAYVDGAVADLDIRSPAVITINCDGIAATYTVTHNLGTTNIASVQIFDTTGGTRNPIGISWEPTTAGTITLKPDLILPATMTLLIVVCA
jgi:hypothetical protein